MTTEDNDAADRSGPPSSRLKAALGLVRAGLLEAAEEELRKGLDEHPAEPVLWVTLAGVRGRQGDADGQFQALRQALAIDPCFLPALLLRANAYEARGNPVLAATSYEHALRVAPDRPYWPGDLREELEHAQCYVQAHCDALRRHLDGELALLAQSRPPDAAARWTEAAAIRAGQSQPYLSHSNQLYVPRLPAVPFFDAAGIPGLNEFGGHVAGIRDEFLRLLHRDVSRLEPYIAFRPGEPVNQWHELDRSTRWQALHLYRGGNAVEENLADCPLTARVLAEAPLCDLSGLCPNVFFSILAPHTKIPPHFGESNARVIAHLPLIVPKDCGIRVGFERREWKPGGILVFDDTLEHEAWNNSAEMRVVLIFDLWNPLLSAEERTVASTLARATREFRGVRQGASAQVW